MSMPYRPRWTNAAAQACMRAWPLISHRNSILLRILPDQEIAQFVFNDLRGRSMPSEPKYVRRFPQTHNT